jgi:hypothetical protein
MRGFAIILLANASMRASNHLSCASVTIPGHVTLAQAQKYVAAVEQKRMTEAAMAKLGSVLGPEPTALPLPTRGQN